MNVTKIVRHLTFGALTALAIGSTQVRADSPYCVFRGFFPGGQGFECYDQPFDFCTYANGHCDQACYEFWGPGNCGYANSCYPQLPPPVGHFNVLCECYGC